MEVFGTESPDKLPTAAAAADCQIEHNFSFEDVIVEKMETSNGRTKTDIGDAVQNSSVDETKTADDDKDGQNSSVDETKTADDDNEGRVENPNTLKIPDDDDDSDGMEGAFPSSHRLGAQAMKICRASESYELGDGMVGVFSSSFPRDLVGTSAMPSVSYELGDGMVGAFSSSFPRGRAMTTAAPSELFEREKCLKNKMNYKFFYGGKDEWIQKFRKKATALANDLILVDLDINIELCCVSPTARGEEHLVQKLWDSLKGLLSGKAKKQVEPLPKEIEKLLSDKDLSLWAVLSNDPKDLITGDGFTFLRVIEEFDQWKEALEKNNSFDLTFKDYYDKISHQVSTVAGK